MRGSGRIEKREVYKMMMMIGHPASRKTTWVEKHVAVNLEKLYNVISTTTRINKITVNGEPRKKYHAERVGADGAEGDKEPLEDV